MIGSQVSTERSPTSRTQINSSGGIQLLVALCVAVFLGNVNAIAIGPFLTLISEDLDTPVPVLGQSVTAMLIFSAAVGLVAGPVADHVGPRRVMLVGMASLVACAFGTAVATSFLGFVAARMIGGVSAAILNGLSLAIVGIGFSGPARRRAMSLAVASLASAPIIGTPILTLIGETAGWRAAFIAIGVAGMLGIVLVRFTLPADRPHLDAKLRLSSVLGAYASLIDHAPTLRIFGANALRNICWMGFLTYMGAFLAEEHGLNLRQIGLTYIVGGSGYFLGSLVAGGRLGNFNLTTMFAVATILTGFGMGTIFVVPLGAIQLSILLLLSGFVGAVGWVALTTLLIGRTPAGPATTMVFNGSIFNLGSALGGAVGGLLLALGGYEAMGIGLPIFAVVSAALVWQPWAGRATGRELVVRVPDA